MTTAIDALALYFQDIFLGTVGETIFEDHMPDTNDGTLDECLVIYSTGGGLPPLTQGDDTDILSFQLRARNSDIDGAAGLLQLVYQALHGLTETDIHGVHFKLIWFVQSGPVSLGRDERSRFHYSQNFRAMVRGINR